MRAPNALELLTIYNSPKDFPGKFAVRCWRVSGNALHQGNLVGIGSTLEDARRYIPLGMVRMDRNISDDPVIVETWI